MSAVEHVPVVAASVVHSEPVVDLSALPVADRLAVARAALAQVSTPVDELIPPASSPPVRALCSFETFNETDGEVYRCGLPAHDWKVKHAAWIKL